MKSGSFVIEFVQSSESVVLYLVRTINGQIVQVCESVLKLQEFLFDNDSKILGSDKNEAS